MVTLGVFFYRFKLIFFPAAHIHIVAVIIVFALESFLPFFAGVSGKLALIIIVCYRSTDSY